MPARPSGKASISDMDPFDSLIKSRFIEMFGDCKTKVPISEVCTLHSRIGWQALTKAEHMASGDYMLITGTDFDNGVVDYSGCKYVSKERYDMDPNIMVQNGDVLVTKDGTIGKVAVVKDLPKPATLNAGIFVVRNKDDSFITEFIQQCLLSTDFQRFIESVKRGATIVHLNQEKFLKYEIPVADIELQRQFTDFVKQVDKSRFIYKQIVSKFDDLVKSRFIEMFGTIDLSSQKEEWRRIGDVGTILTGSTPKTSEPSFWDGDLKWIAPAELTSESYIINDTERKITEAGRRSCSLNLLKPGVVLLSSRAPIGKVGIVGSEMYCNQGFKNIECGPELNNVFLYVLLKNNGEYLNSLGRGATFKEISAKIVENIRIPVPPLDSRSNSSRSSIRSINRDLTSSPI